MSVKTTIYQFSSSQQGKAVDAVATPSREKTLWHWVNIFGEYDDIQQYLSEHFHLDPLIVETLTAQETRPRAVEYPNGTLILLRGVNLNPGKDPEDMLTLRFWMTENLIISCHRQNSLSINNLLESVGQGKKFSSPSNLFIAICDLLTQVMSDTIDDLDESLDDLEEALINSVDPEILVTLVDLRRQALIIRRYLAPQRDMLYHLQLSDTLSLTDLHKLRLREINERLLRYIEELDSSRERAVICMEQINNKQNEQLNQRMLVLSIVAALFLPLSFITGLLGVNVAGIPGANNHHAFGILSGALGLLGVGLAILFKKWKWL